MCNIRQHFGSRRMERNKLFIFTIQFNGSGLDLRFQ